MPLQVFTVMGWWISAGSSTCCKSAYNRSAGSFLISACSTLASKIPFVFLRTVKGLAGRHSSNAQESATYQKHAVSSGIPPHKKINKAFLLKKKKRNSDEVPHTKKEESSILIGQAWTIAQRREGDRQNQVRHAHSHIAPMVSTLSGIAEVPIISGYG